MFMYFILLRYSLVELDTHLRLEWYSPILFTGSDADLLVIIIQDSAHGIQDKLEEIINIATWTLGAVARSSTPPRL